MKSDEVIKKLTDNAKQTFVNEYGIRVTNLGGFIVQANGEEFTFNVGYEWEEVLESVTFIEAINSGKRIRPVTWANYSTVPGTIKYLSSLCVGNAIDLMNDKWYIENES